MTDKRKSNRSRAVVNYSKFSRDDIDDDFHDSTPPPEKKNDRKSKRKKETKNGSEENDEWGFDATPKKKRLSVDEKKFERDLQLAKNISRSNSSDKTDDSQTKSSNSRLDSSDKTDDSQTNSRNPVLVDDTDDIEFIGTVSDVKPKRPLRGNNSVIETRKTTKKTTRAMTSDSDISEEETSSEEISDEDFDPLDSDSERKSKGRTKTSVNKTKKSPRSKLTAPRLLKQVQVSSDHNSNESHKPDTQDDEFADFPLDKTTPPVIPENILAPTSGNEAELSSPQISYSPSALKPYNSTPSSTILRSPSIPKQTQMSSSTPKSSLTPKTSVTITPKSVSASKYSTPKSTLTMSSPLTSPLTSPGLRLGLSRKQRVKSLHPSVMQ